MGYRKEQLILCKDISSIDVIRLDNQHHTIRSEDCGKYVVELYTKERLYQTKPLGYKCDVFKILSEGALNGYFKVKDFDND